MHRTRSRARTSLAFSQTLPSPLKLQPYLAAGTGGTGTAFHVRTSSSQQLNSSNTHTTCLTSSNSPHPPPETFRHRHLPATKDPTWHKPPPLRVHLLRSRRGRRVSYTALASLVCCRNLASVGSDTESLNRNSQELRLVPVHIARPTHKSYFRTATGPQQS